MPGRPYAALCRLVGRPGALLALALGVLAQSVALPWHLAVEHHGRHAGHGEEHSDGHAHEHPSLPGEHDEDDHEYSSTLIAAQARERFAPADAPAPTIHGWLVADGGAKVAIRGAGMAVRERHGGTPQGAPIEIAGARGPPAASRPQSPPSR